MLCRAAITDDKNLQQKQIQNVDEWFYQNLDIINYRTKPPLHQKFSSQNKINQGLIKVSELNSSDQNNILKNLAPGFKSMIQSPQKHTIKKNFITSKDVIKEPFRDQSQESIGYGGSPSTSKGSIVKRQIGQNDQSNQESQVFMNKRVDMNKTQSSFLLKDYDYGTQDYTTQLNKIINQTTQNSLSRTRMQQQIKSSLVDWSQQKKLRQSINLHRKEMLHNSNFQSLGVSIRSQAQTTMGGTRSQFRRNEFSNTKSVEHKNYQNFDDQFLDFNNEEDLRSDDLETSSQADEIKEIELGQKSHSQNFSKIEQKSFHKIKRVIDLTKDTVESYAEVYDQSQKEPPKKVFKLPPELEGMKLPPPPLTLDQLQQKLQHTPSTIKNIDAKSLSKLRFHRTNIIFNTSAGLNKSIRLGEDISQPNESIIKVEDLLNQTQQTTTYPLIHDEKQNIDSAVVNNEGSQNEIITLSCFTRPNQKRNFHTQKQSFNLNKLPSLHQQIQDQNQNQYNFKLVAKQNNQKMLELQEIQQIKQQLARNPENIHIKEDVLAKAIIYENERNELDTNVINQGKRYHSQQGRDNGKREINYPKMGEFLLKNPFEKTKEKSKKKKKKR
eukprot:403375540